MPLGFPASPPFPPPSPSRVPLADLSSILVLEYATCSTTCPCPYSFCLAFAASLTLPDCNRDKTTLSYAAIFGIKKPQPVGLNLVGTAYSLASSAFYFGWAAVRRPLLSYLPRAPRFRLFSRSSLSTSPPLWATVADLACARVSSLAVGHSLQLDPSEESPGSVLGLQYLHV